MATLIEAIIFDGDPETAALPMGLRAVPLPGDLTMLPVTAEVASGLDPDAIGDERIPDNWNLQQPVAALARALSHDRRVVYFFSATWPVRALGKASPGEQVSCCTGRRAPAIARLTSNPATS